MEKSRTVTIGRYRPEADGASDELTFASVGKQNLDRCIELTSEQSYLSGDDNLAPRQFRFDGHHQIKLVIAPVQFGPDPSKGSSNGIKGYWDRDIPASVSGAHAATTTFEVDGHLFEGLNVNSMHDNETG
ncbi:hypothetical protein RCH14_000955 [Massilia sp. MP_M2]|uniref:hypothetical protein n=1 Tax=Massilia sp. MP_M2 TaxID=3071713 RepID=UPI00319E8E21